MKTDITSEHSHHIKIWSTKRSGHWLHVDDGDTVVNSKLTRGNLIAMKRWLEEFFAVGCEAHGAEGCIECEKRCEWCGVDGDMEERDGERICEDCAYMDDEEKRIYPEG